jgi:CBS domain containing-hemolysin-like protein
MLIFVHWITGSYEFGVVLMPESIRRNYIHRIVCAIALGQLLLLACGQLFIWCCIYRVSNMLYAFLLFLRSIYQTLNIFFAPSIFRCTAIWLKLLFRHFQRCIGLWKSGHFRMNENNFSFG